MGRITKKLCRLLLLSKITPHSIRMRALKSMGYKIGEQACVFYGQEFWINDFHLGNYSFINKNCTFSGFGTEGSLVDIGDNVMVGHNVIFCCVSHKIGNAKHRAGDHICKPIYVGNGCWIGAGVIILPGVTIGHGCVIAAGSVVTKNCDCNCLYAGVPAKKIKDLNK